MKIHGDKTDNTKKTVGDLEDGDVFLRESENGTDPLIACDEMDDDDARLCTYLRNGMIVRLSPETPIMFLPDAEVRMGGDR